MTTGPAYAASAMMVVSLSVPGAYMSSLTKKQRPPATSDVHTKRRGELCAMGAKESSTCGSFIQAPVVVSECSHDSMACMTPLGRPVEPLV